MYRASEEVQGLIGKITAEADALQATADGRELTPEETAKLTELVAQLESLNQELAAVQAQERLAAVKAKGFEPSKPAPRITPVTRERPKDKVSFGEGFTRWANFWLGDGDVSAESMYRAKQAGFNVGSRRVTIPIDFGTLNRRERKLQRSMQRTALSTTGAGTGAEWIWYEFGEKVVEYLTYFSPLLGLVASETSKTRQEKPYFQVDDTAMESNYDTYYAGSEVAPTIPEKNVVSDVVKIKCFGINSGYQKVTREELQESFVNIENTVAKATSNSHARFMEREIITATGDGVSGVQGLMTVADAVDGSPVSAWSQDVIEDSINEVPLQYRQNVILLSNDSTKSSINRTLRDDIGRSLFDKTVDQDYEYDTLLGKKYIVSEYMDDDDLLIFDPSWYQLRLVEGVTFEMLDQKFHPLLAWYGHMSFGARWIGPTSAVKKVSKS